MNFSPPHPLVPTNYSKLVLVMDSNPFRTPNNNATNSSYNQMPYYSSSQPMTSNSQQPNAQPSPSNLPLQFQQQPWQQQQSWQSQQSVQPQQPLHSQYNQLALANRQDSLQPSFQQQQYSNTSFDSHSNFQPTYPNTNSNIQAQFQPTYAHTNTGMPSASYPYSAHTHPQFTPSQQSSYDPSTVYIPPNFGMNSLPPQGQVLQQVHYQSSQPRHPPVEATMFLKSGDSIRKVACPVCGKMLEGDNFAINHHVNDHYHQNST